MGYRISYGPRRKMHWCWAAAGLAGMALLAAAMLPEDWYNLLARYVGGLIDAAR